MKAFTINAEGNITAFESREAAEQNLPPPGAFVFTTAPGLQGYLKKFPAATAVEIWNSLTGVAPVKKFKSTEVAAKRIFAELQKLGGSTAEPNVAKTNPLDDLGQTLNTDAPKGKRAPKVKAKAQPEKATKTPKGAKKAKAAKPAGSGPREGSKTSQVIEMLKRKSGATLDEIMTKFEWQQHTTRALLSAGGSITKKFGLTVISEKVGDKRIYSIKA